MTRTPAAAARLFKVVRWHVASDGSIIQIGRSPHPDAGAAPGQPVTSLHVAAPCPSAVSVRTSAGRAGVRVASLYTEVTLGSCAATRPAKAWVTAGPALPRPLGPEGATSGSGAGATGDLGRPAALSKFEGKRVRRIDVCARTRRPGLTSTRVFVEEQENLRTGADARW